MGGSKGHIGAPNKIYLRSKYLQTPEKYSFQVLLFFFWAPPYKGAPGGSKYPLISPPNPVRTLKVIIWHQSTKYSLSFAPKMTKIFNKVQEISPFEGSVTTGHIYDKYGPTGIFDHKNIYKMSK
jgi:hypothetical protein